MSNKRPDERKVHLRIESEQVREMKSEARRQGRALSYMGQLAWCLAKDEIRTMPQALVPGMRHGRKT